MGFVYKAALGVTAIMVAEPASKVAIAAINGVTQVSINEKAAFRRGYEEGYRDAVAYVTRMNKRL